MSFEEIKKAQEAANKAAHDFKQENDARLAKLEARGTTDPLFEAKVDKANAAIDLRIAQIETAMNRKAQSERETAQGLTAEQKASKAAMSKALKKGFHSLSADEVKQMSVNSDPDGGFLVTDEMSSEIVQKVFESSPVRAMASVQTLSSDVLDMMEDLDEAGDGWVGETEARGETTTPVFKQIKIPVHEQQAEPHTTQKLLDDAAFNVESWLSQKVTVKFARSEATAFITGTGVKKPRGILTYANGTSFGTIEQVVSGHATLFTSDGLLSLIYSLKEPYHANAAWGLQRASIGSIRKLKDSNNNYLWGFQQMGPAGVGLNGPAFGLNLLGYPVRMMADIPSVGASALAAIFGDFRAGYQIVDRMGIRVLRDNLTSKGFVKFYTTRRVGGDVKNFEALKIQKISA